MKIDMKTSAAKPLADDTDEALILGMAGDLDFDVEGLDIEWGEDEEAYEAREEAEIAEMLGEECDNAALLGLASDEISEDEIARAPQIRASLPAAGGEYCVALLEQSKAEFDATGIGTACMVLVFKYKATPSDLTAFRQRVQVKMTRIRKAAEADGYEVPKFVTTKIVEQPVEPDESGASSTWLIKAARMHPDNYRAWQRLTGSTGRPENSDTTRAMRAL